MSGIVLTVCGALALFNFARAFCNEWRTDFQRANYYIVCALYWLFIMIVQLLINVSSI